MKENVSMVTAVLAIVISIVAITSTVVIGPVSIIGASSVGGNELKDNSVTGNKIADGALTNDDISNIGISKIADNAITLLHLSPEVISAMTGETNVAATIEDDSITSAKIADGTITDDDINDSGISKIADNSITLAHLTSAVINAMTGVTDIADNSITSLKIADGTITNVDISDSADIAPSKILGAAWTAGNDGSGSGLDADTLDGMEGDQFLRNDASGSLTGDLIIDGTATVDSVIYSSPRIHYFIVGGEGFIPGDDDIDYTNTYGTGGAVIKTGSSGSLVSPVHLPHGAEVTAFKVFFYDNSVNDITVSLGRLNMEGIGYSSLAIVSSSGVSEYGSQIDDSISYSTINNKAYSYHIKALWITGDSNIKVRGVQITYTTDRAL